MRTLPTALLVAASWFAAPLAQAQDAPLCGREDTPPCDTGPCPLLQLPYESFLAEPPSSRGGNAVPRVSERPFNPDEGDRILVKGFRVEGVSSDPQRGITPQTVQGAANDAFRRETGGAAEGRLTVGHMARVADAVTTFYRSKEYLVARAFLPAQEIGSDAVVTIRVLEGRVSEVVVEGAQHYSPDVLRKPSAGLVGKTPTRGDVETALLYTQDYPGVQLFGTFKPGAQQGDTKLVLQVQNEDRLGFQVGGDNYGNEFTGQYRARTDISWRNPLGRGDELNATVLQAFNPSNTTFGSLGYRIPFGPRGFGATAAVSHNSFTVAGPLEILKLEGTIDAVSLGADWKFTRERFRTETAGLVLERRQSNLDSTATSFANDSYNVIGLQFDGDYVDTATRGVNQLTGALRQGLGADFGTGEVDESFTVLQVRYARIQALAETQTAVFRTRGQYTANVLSPLEQFSLAGPDAVRAYPVGQALTDSGLYGSLEYRVQAPGFAGAAGPFGRTWGDLVTLLAFVDYASGSENGTGAQGEDLSGAGGGLQLSVPGRFQFLVQGAVPLSSAEASDGDDFRIYGEFSLKF